MQFHTYVPTELHRYGHTQLHGYAQILPKEKGAPQKVPPLMELEFRRLIRIDRRDTPADPSHDRDSHRVADRLVARAVGTFLGGFALPSDQRMPIGETLQAFTLERSEPTDEHGIGSQSSLSDFRCDHRAVASAPEGRRDISADSRMGVEVAHDDGIGAGGADEGRLLHAGSGGERSAEGSIADDTHLIAGILREPEGLVGGILGYRSAHHHGRIVLAHMRGQASCNLVADMAMRLRARHADDVLAPVRTGGRIAPSRKTSCDLGAVLG